MANGFQKFQGFGAPANDLSTSEGLLALAQSQGGAVSQVATELVHPNTSILSTIGNGFKNAFSGFVDIISTPSQAVAGAISSKYTMKQAMDLNIAPSDVIYGKSDPNASIYQKVGGFLVRTATDILLDPLTYITFGAGGVFGAAGKSSIILGEKAAASFGTRALDAAVVSKEGQEVVKYISKLSKQAVGSSSYESIKAAHVGQETFELVNKELDALLKTTIDAPLDENFVKEVMSSVLEKNPALTHTLLDKGGIKVFGQTILSSQRLGTTIKMIPGMNTLDVITEQPRRALLSLVNPNYIKNSANLWERIPSGLTDMAQRSRDLITARGDQRIKPLANVIKALDLNETEAQFLMAAQEHNMIPSDARLAKAFKFMRDYSDEDWKQLVDNGLLSKEVKLENHAPHMLVEVKPTSVSFRMPPSVATGANEMRKGAKFTNAETGESIVGFADDLGLKSSGVNDNVFIGEGGKQYLRESAPLHNVGSLQEFQDIEDTLLKDPKKAAKMMQDIRQEGFEIFDENLMTAWAARSLKNVKAITMKDFVHDVAKNFGVASENAPKGFVSISSTAINKEGSVIMSAVKDGGDMMFHPTIAAYIEKFAGSMINDDATMDFLKSYDKLQNIWKASVTSIWPAFHGRNAISNVLQNFLDLGLGALDPRTHAVSTQMLFSNRTLNALERDVIKGTAGSSEKMGALLAKTAFTDASGYEWSVGELRQVMKNHGIAFTSRVVNATDAAGGPEKIAKQLFAPTTIKGKLGKVIDAPVSIGQDVVGKSLEEQARMVNFITNLKNTGDVTMAARRTKQFLFDYGNLTNFERNVMRRIVPFYTFVRKNLELQATALIKTPGRIATEIHTIGSLGEVLSGGQQLSDEEKAALPDWMKAGLTILAKKNGDQANIITNLGTPLEAPFQLMQANNVLGSVSPLLRLPTELGAGYSFFAGKPLSEVTNAAAFQRAPKIIKDMIGFTTIEGTRSDGTPYTWNVALHPKTMHLLLNLPPTSRVFTTLKNLDNQDLDTQAKVVQQLIGTRIYSVDLVAEQNKREKDMKRQLEDLLTKAGITAKFTRTYIPDQQKSSFEGFSGF